MHPLSSLAPEIHPPPRLPPPARGEKWGKKLDTHNRKNKNTQHPRTINEKGPRTNNGSGKPGRRRGLK